MLRHSWVSVNERAAGSKEQPDNGGHANSRPIYYKPQEEWTTKSASAWSGKNNYRPQSFVSDLRKQVDGLGKKPAR